MADGIDWERVLRAYVRAVMDYDAYVGFECGRAGTRSATADLTPAEEAALEEVVRVTWDAWDAEAGNTG